jgi:hypothetical protein
VRARRTWAATALVALAGALAGCGGDGGGSASTSAPSGFDPQQALLQLSDLPAGWVQDPPDPEARRASPCGVTFADSAREEAQTAYSLDELPTLRLNVFSFAPGEAEKAIGALRAALPDCPPATLEVNGQQVTAITEPIRFPQLGDESIAVRQDFTLQGFPFTGLGVATRVGDGITGVILADLGSVDRAELERFARLAVARLRSVTAG